MPKREKKEEKREEKEKKRDIYRQAERLPA
jgi:hypothetical protein